MGFLFFPEISAMRGLIDTIACTIDNSIDYSNRTGVHRSVITYKKRPVHSFRVPSSRFGGYLLCINTLAKSGRDGTGRF